VPLSAWFFALCELSVLLAPGPGDVDGIFVSTRRRARHTLSASSAVHQSRQISLQVELAALSSNHASIVTAHPFAP